MHMRKPFQPVITWSHPDPPSDIILVIEPAVTPTDSKRWNIRNVSLLGCFGETVKLRQPLPWLLEDCIVFLETCTQKALSSIWLETEVFIFLHQLRQPKKEEKEKDVVEESPEEAKVTREEDAAEEVKRETEGAAEGEQGTGEEGQASIFQSPLRLVKKGKMKLVVCRVNLLDGTDFTCEVEVSSWKKQQLLKFCYCMKSFFKISLLILPSMNYGHPVTDYIFHDH